LPVLKEPREELRVTALTAVLLSFGAARCLVGMIASDCELDEDAIEVRVSVFESEVSSGQEPGVVSFNLGT
jgi:hypothetical protein